MASGQQSQWHGKPAYATAATVKGVTPCCAPQHSALSDQQPSGEGYTLLRPQHSAAVGELLSSVRALT